MKLATTAALGMTVLTVACTEQETGARYAEPTFNKFGQPSCRPPDVPLGGLYTADLPLCAYTSVAIAPAGGRTGTQPTNSGTAPTGADGGSDAATDPTDGTDTSDDTSTDPTTGGNGTQNQNAQSTQNANQNTSNNRNQAQSGNGNP